jgi:acyl-CoA-binding protein
MFLRLLALFALSTSAVFGSVQDFERASTFVKTSPDANADDDLKLRFYALFKQGKVGQCNTQRPALSMNPLELIDSMARQAMWDAWKGLGDMPQEVAREQYIALLDETVPAWRS